jgi:hypothetical protein
MARLSSYNTRSWQWRKLRFRLIQTRHLVNWQSRMWVPSFRSQKSYWRYSWVSSSRCSIGYDIFFVDTIRYYDTPRANWAPAIINNVTTPLDTLSVLNRLLFSTWHTLVTSSLDTLVTLSKHLASGRQRAVELRHQLRYSSLFHRSSRTPDKELIVLKRPHTPSRLERVRTLLGYTTFFHIYSYHYHLYYLSLFCSFEPIYTIL